MSVSIFVGLCLLLNTISTLTTNSPREMVSILNITKSHQKDGVCILDYSLSDRFKDLPIPPWLTNWDDIMPNTFCKHKYDIKIDKEFDHNQISHRLLFSLASGVGIDAWHNPGLQKRFSNFILEEMMDSLWNTGDIPRSDTAEEAFEEKAIEVNSLKKRTIVELLDPRSLVELYHPRWIYRPGYRAKVNVLRSIQRDLEAEGDKIIVLKRSSICKYVDYIYGCLLWSGNSKIISAKVAAAAIDSGIDNRGDAESINASADRAFKEVILHTACLGSNAECNR